MKNWRLGVILIVARGNMVLIAKKPSANEWQLPAGGREIQETVLETAKREAQEELGLIVDPSQMKVSFIVREYEWSEEWKAKRGTDGQRQHIVMIALRDDQEITVNSQELAHVRFVPKRELLDELTHQDIKETLREMQKLGEIHLL